MGEKQDQPFQLSFNPVLKVDFQGSRVTSDSGLLLVRELDERLGLSALITDAIGLPANDNLLRDIEELLTRPVGRPSYQPIVSYKCFLYEAASWKTARRNAECIVMRGPIFRDPAGWSLWSCSTPHKGARCQRRDQLVGGLETAGT